MDTLHRRYGGGVSFLLSSLSFDEFLQFLFDVFEEENDEFQWRTYIDTKAYYEKSFTEYKEEVSEKLRLNAMSKEELTELADRVEGEIAEFFGKA